MAGVLGFGSCGLESALEEVKAQSPATAGWGAAGCVGLAGVFGFGSLRWLEGWKRSKTKAQP